MEVTPKKEVKRYNAEAKLEAVQLSISRGFGGITSVAKELGVSHAALSQWRREYAKKLKKAGSDASFARPRQARQYMSNEQEAEFLSWYGNLPAPVPILTVLSKLKETHPTIFVSATNDDEDAYIKRAKNWLHMFLKRHKKKGESESTAASGESAAL